MGRRAFKAVSAVALRCVLTVVIMNTDRLNAFLVRGTPKGYMICSRIKMQPYSVRTRDGRSYHFSVGLATQDQQRGYFDVQARHQTIIGHTPAEKRDVRIVVLPSWQCCKQSLLSVSSKKATLISTPAPIRGLLMGFKLSQALHTSLRGLEGCCLHYSKTVSSSSKGRIGRGM